VAFSSAFAHEKIVSIDVIANPERLGEVAPAQTKWDRLSRGTPYSIGPGGPSSWTLATSSTRSSEISEEDLEPVSGPGAPFER
jgi:hypothetical protein